MMARYGGGVEAVVVVAVRVRKFRVIQDFLNHVRDKDPP